MTQIYNELEFKNKVQEIIYKIFPSIFLQVDKNEIILNDSILYTASLDIYNSLKIQFSQKTIDLKNQLDSIIVSKHIYYANLLNVYNYFNHIVDNNGDIGIEKFEEILIKLKCKNLLEYLQQYKKSTENMTLLLFLRNVTQNNKEVLKKREVLRLLKYYIQQFELFYNIYDQYIISLTDDIFSTINDKFKQEFGDNIRLCKILYNCNNHTPFYDMINNININSYSYSNISLALDILNETETLIVKLKEKLSENNNIFTTNNYIYDVIEDKHDTITQHKFDVMFKSKYKKIKLIDEIEFGLDFRPIHIKSKVKNNELQSKKILNEMLFNLYLNIYYNKDSKSYNYLFNKITTIPYIPSIIGIEYSNKIYKIFLNIQNGKDIKQDKIIKNCFYINKENIEVIEANMNNINNLYYFGDYTFCPDESNIVKDILNYINDEKINNDSIHKFSNCFLDNICSDMSYLCKCAIKNIKEFNSKNINNNLELHLDYLNYYFNMPLDNFLKNKLFIVYKEMVQYLLFSNNNHIKKKIKSYFTELAYSSINSKLKEFIMKDCKKYNLTFKVICDITNSLTETYGYNKYEKILDISKFNISKSKILNLNKLIDTQNIEKIILQFTTILIDNITGKYLDINDLILLNNHDKLRAKIYQHYFNCSRNYIVFDDPSPYFHFILDDPNSNMNKNYIKILNQIKDKCNEILHECIPEDYINSITQNVYNNMEKFILKCMKKSIGNDLNNCKSFNDFFIEFQYYLGTTLNGLYYEYI